MAQRMSRGLAVLGTLAVLVAAGFSRSGAPAPTALAAPPAGVVQQDDAAMLATGLQALNNFAVLAQNALAQNDVDAARAAYAQFDAGWQAIEDGVRARSRDDYRSIEDAMSDADRALRANPVDTAQASALLGELQNRVNQFVATLTAS